MLKQISNTIPMPTVSSGIKAPSGTGYSAIPMVGDGGTFKVPVTINGQLTLNFVVDSGASDVCIPADIVQTLGRTETITDADFLDKQTYHLADGSTLPSRRFVIRSLKIGDKTLENVVGAISIGSIARVRENSCCTRSISRVQVGLRAMFGTHFARPTPHQLRMRVPA